MEDKYITEEDKIIYAFMEGKWQPIEEWHNSGSFCSIKKLFKREADCQKFCDKENKHREKGKLLVALPTPKGMDFRLHYRTKWDCLMLVVDKIELIEDDTYGRFAVHIYSNGCCIQSTKTDPVHKLPLYMSDPNAILNTKLESTYYNVVSFIKWYSQHKQINS